MPDICSRTSCSERFYGDYLGDDLSEYKLRFQPQNHELESDAILYSPIRDLFREVNQPEDGVWRDRVEQYVDLRQFVTHVAIENFLAEIDGILGTYSMNNFYLYRHAGTSRHRLIVWDKDSTLEFPDFPIFWNAEENVIFRRAMAHRDLFELYLAVLERCALPRLRTIGSNARSREPPRWLRHTYAPMRESGSRATSSTRRLSRSSSSRGNARHSC